MTKDTAPLEQKRQAARQRREHRVKRRRLAGLFIGVIAVALVAVGLTALLNEEGAEKANDAALRPAALDAAAFTGGARLAVDQTMVDHGDVPYGHEVKAEYRLRNVGDQLLRIEHPEVKILDGC